MDVQTLTAPSSHVLLYISAVALLAFGYGAAYLFPLWLPTISKRLLCLAATLSRRATSKEAALEENLPQTTVSKEVDFPSDWWTSSQLFQLERRAIFSKTWLHVCHSSLFKNAGDYRTFRIANFSFFVIFGKDGKLRAFHNVCRHRAYTVATKDQGSSTVLRCKYHGWSYDTKGRLIKAPQFDSVANFNKSQNGLYEIRTFIDSSGFIYVNFDIYGSDGLTIRVGVPIRAKLSLVETWNVEANFNWKIALSPGTFRLRSLAMQRRIPELLSWVGGFQSWKWPAEFELSPLTRVLYSSTEDMVLTIAIIPHTSTTCTIACTLFCTKLDMKAGFPVSAIKAEVSDSVKKLQMIFDEVKDDGVIDDIRSQEPLLAEIKAHTRLERLTNSEVHPASRLKETSQACQVADDLCKQLEATAASKSSSAPVDGADIKDMSW